MSVISLLFLSDLSVAINLKCIGASIGEKPELTKKLPATTTVTPLAFFFSWSILDLVVLRSDIWSWHMAHIESKRADRWHLPFMHIFFCWGGEIISWGVGAKPPQNGTGYRGIFVILSSSWLL